MGRKGGGVGVMDFGEVVKSRPHGHFQKSAPMLHTVISAEFF